MCVKESLSVAARGASMSNPRMATRLATLIVSLWIITLISADSDGEILLALKENWQASLPTWADVDNLCKNWEGVTCQQGRVFALNLTNKGLKGPIPDGIGNLASLTSLDLSTSNWSSGPPNQITGDISVLASLTNLRTLNMTYNVLKTEFPTSLLKLTQLIALRLDNTYLTGPFPTGISNLVNLQYLYLGNCFLSGDLPSELGNLVNLVELSLWNNPFKSKLPVEISNLSKLTYLNLHNCSLWGGLPEEFGKLKSMKRLHLYTNLLTGTIPYSWKNMTNLQDLRLQYNFLTKNFPSWLLLMSNLTYLGLSYNQFYGPFPNLNNTDLKTVKLECNYFSGPFPTIVSNAALTYAGNCFSNTTAENDTSKYLCSREYSCSGFQQQLIGSCPDCPTGQTFTNVSDCICSEDGVGVPNRSKSVGIEILKIVGPILAGIFVLFVALIIFYKRWNYKRDILRLGSFFSVRELNENWDVPKGVERFTLQELSRATSNFHKDHEIGVGGFGKVFFGILENGKKVAIKRASALSMQGSSEFYNEVLLLSRLHHRNLVRLEGFCEESGLQILVYEYMTKGNLQAWLFQNEAGPALDWYKRLEVAVGIAQGLEYLHSFADPPVIHRDVKPSNILLDENLVAKLADFGLSRATPEFHTHVSTTPAGTAGYIDPQYFLRRQLTTASDVYGFGVVLLEIITGQKAIDNSRLEEHNLIEWVKPKLNKDGIKGIIDPRLGSDFPEKIFLDIAWLAIGCASFNKEDRPSMKEALTILEAHLQSVAPLPEQENCQSNQGLSQHISEEKWSKSFTSPETSIGYSTASHADFEGSILLPR